MSTISESANYPDEFFCISPTVRAQLQQATSDGSGTSVSGATGSASKDSSSVPRTDAAGIIESIGRDFVQLRKEGRSTAWAELEDRLMGAAHILIEAGLMSPKDWIGLAIDIEQFRKQEQGTQQAPGDFLQQWLSVPADPPPPAEKVVPRSTKKVKKVKS